MLRDHLRSFTCDHLQVFKYYTCTCEFLSTRLASQKKASLSYFISREVAKKTVAMSSRSSTRVSKRPRSFQWTSDGRSYAVPKVLIQVRAGRNEELAELFVGKSTISRGGKGVLAKKPINPGDYISEYQGEIISVWDAIKLLDQVTGHPLRSL